MSTDEFQDDRVPTYAERERREIRRDENTRVYRESSNPKSLPQWVHGLQEHFSGELLPFEWVPEYVGVSRASVHKRMRKGQLTVFVLEVLDEFTPVLRWTRPPKTRRECKYVPRTECDAWILSRIDPQLLERGDVSFLQSEHVRGWWNEPQK